MQLATISEKGPWVCSVYYVADEDLNLYWLSFPTRRHSQDIATDSRVAVTVALKTDQPVVGVQAEGDVSMVTDKDVVARVMDQYVLKYDNGTAFHDNFLAGTNEHQLYQLKPHTYVLFDEVTFPDDGRQEMAC